MSETFPVDGPSPGAELELVPHPTQKRTAVIRTSDRSSFRNCRRKWNWTSGLRENREPLTAASPLWFGSGIHFALEDHHGWKKFDNAVHAFDQYVKACCEYYRQMLPPDWQEHHELGLKMLDYYINHWLTEERDNLSTVYIDGVPQVEVNFIVEVPFPLEQFGYDKYYDKVVYTGTIDRVVRDVYGNLWLLDYKTAKQIKTSHLANEPQANAYTWAGAHLYGEPVQGIIWQQHLKAVPKGGRVLQSGDVSVAQNQVTSRVMYKQTLIEQYGSIEDTPKDRIEFLNGLAMMESDDHDSYIRRDKIFKSERQHQSTGYNIMLELIDMLNPHLPIYPNPTFLCGSICEMYEYCVSMDDGSDWEEQIESATQRRDDYDTSWRHYLNYDPPLKKEVKA